MKENVIILTDADGNDVKYDLMASFVKDEREFIIYTDNTKDEDGFIKTYAGIYKKLGDKESLLPIEDDEDFEYVEKMLKKIERESN